MRILPETRWADKIVAFKKFVKRHKRLPSRRMTMNDEYYRIKTSDMIHDPLRVFVSDKEYVKLYVRAVVGEDYNVPTLGIIRSPEAIADYDFPRDCCVTATHASEAVMFRREGAALDYAELTSWFKLNHYSNGREANYRYLKPKIIIEPILAPTAPLLEYRIYCYQGRPRMIVVLEGAVGHRKMMVFDTDWTPQAFTMKFPRADQVYPRPKNLDEIMDVAARLSAGFASLIRVDLYRFDHKILVGEITNVNANAQQTFIPPKGEELAAKLLFGA